MSNEIIIIIFALSGFFLGALILFILYNQISKRQIKNLVKQHQTQLENQEINYKTRIDKYEEQIIDLQADCKKAEKELFETKSDLRQSLFMEQSLQQKLNTQKTELTDLQAKFKTDFENLAQKILEQKSEKFTQQNHDQINQLLNPLQEKIKSFESKVDQSNLNAAKQYTALEKQLQFLNQQNIRISEEATNLTQALKGNSKMQGNWGEMILERVLERSGLQKNSEYFVQQHFTTDDGKRYFPDVIIALPGEKKMVVDSKVSLTAYETYCNTQEESEKKAALKQHLLSVEKHISSLSGKNYQKLYPEQSPDFVLLFIPIEAAFALASQENPQLYSQAFDKNIILVTPTTLLAVLRTIDSMWQNEKQQQNAIEIATRAGALYDSFHLLIEELDKLGQQITTVQRTYDRGMKKLTGKGNLISKVEKLKKLGAKANKQLEKQ